MKKLNRSKKKKVSKETLNWLYVKIIHVLLNYIYTY